MADKNKIKNGVANIGDIEVTNGDAWSGNDEAPSPVQPPSSASSGFSDDDSLHGDLGLQAVSMEQLVETIHSRGCAGLAGEYAEIKLRPPDGSFNNAKYVYHFIFQNSSMIKQNFDHKDKKLEVYSSSYRTL